MSSIVFHVSKYCWGTTLLMECSSTTSPRTSGAPTTALSGGNTTDCSGWLGSSVSSFNRYLIAYKNLLRAIENIGIAVVYGNIIWYWNDLQWKPCLFQVSGTMAQAASLMTTTSSSSDTMRWASSTSIRARTLFLRYILNVQWQCNEYIPFDFPLQVRKDYETLKSQGKDFPILMTSRDN